MGPSKWVCLTSYQITWIPFFGSLGGLTVTWGRIYECNKVVRCIQEHRGRLVISRCCQAQIQRNLLARKLNIQAPNHSCCLTCLMLYGVNCDCKNPKRKMQQTPNMELNFILSISVKPSTQNLTIHLPTQYNPNLRYNPPKNLHSIIDELLSSILITKLHLIPSPLNSS